MMRKLTLLLLILSLIILSACETVDEPPVTQLPPGLDPTPVVCAPLPEGMSLEATFHPPTSVWLEMGGFVPGEPVRFIVNVTLPENRSTGLERLSEMVVGIDGRYTEEIALNVPVAEVQSGEIQVVYGQGVACAEIARAVTIRVNGQIVVLTPGENVAPDNYALAQDADFAARADWVLINGLWEPLAPGVDMAIDICQVDPFHPDCAGLRPPTPTAMPGVPAEWQTWTDPTERLAFDYPAGWQVMPVRLDAGDGIQVMNAPSPAQATQWVRFHVFLNPDAASLPVWIAEWGPVWDGEITATDEDLLMGIPVLRQRLENEAPAVDDATVYALLWVPYGEYVLLWTAWPGDQPETINILERMVIGLRTWPGE
jgi:hypothetical protein